MRPAIAALLLAVAACGTARPPAAQTPGATPCTPEVREGGDKDAAMFLTAVRVARQERFDRVVFEFTPREDQPASVPFWRIEPATPPLQEDGSGEEIEVAGDAFLRTIVWATGVDLSGETFREVYTGPKQFTPPDTENVREVRSAGDFENVLTWYLGLRRESCFTVREFRDPVRIVIDM